MHFPSPQPMEVGLERNGEAAVASQEDWQLRSASSYGPLLGGDFFFRKQPYNFDIGTAKAEFKMEAD
jgi:hypothetical protein